MATFYYNRYSGESIESQWNKYLQNDAYVKDIGSIISKNRRELQITFQNASTEQVKAIQQVYGKLDDGFAEVSSYLNSINTNISELRGEISAMAAMLDWKLSLLIEEQRLTNQLLGHIAQLLRIPDSQKQRVYYIEQGLKYLKNALPEETDSTFYTDAFESFQDAEKIERKDYITLNRIGQIYLYSSKYRNFSNAQDYFLKSARESFAEYNAGGTTAPMVLIPFGLSFDSINTVNNVDNRIIELCKNGKLLVAVKLCQEEKGWGLKESKDYIDEVIVTGLKNASIVNHGKESNSSLRGFNTFLLATAESYLYAGRACYLQHKLLEAADYAGKAYNLIPDLTKAGFEQAKYLAANNQENEAAKVLETVIEKDRLFSCYTLEDPDLSSKPTILKVLENIQRRAIAKAKQQLEECNEVLSHESKAKGLLDEIEEHISKNSFLSGMKALDMLSASYQLSYMQSKLISEEIRIRSVSPNKKILDFLVSENNSISQLEGLKKQAKDEITRMRTLGFGGAGAGIGFVVGFFKGCTVKDFSLDGGLWFGTILLFTLIGALVGFFQGSVSDPTVREVKDNDEWDRNY